MTRALLILSVLASLSRAEIIDRIAVTLDNQVITESEILRDFPDLTAKISLDGCSGSLANARSRR